MINHNPKYGFGYDYPRFFTDLSNLYRAILDNSDVESVEKILDVAEWGFYQGRRTPDFRNASRVCFYDHLFDVPRKHWDSVISRLAPEVIKSCWGLWESRLGDEKVEQLRDRIGVHYGNLGLQPRGKPFQGDWRGRVGS